MAASTICMQYAIVAFSALVYSIKVDRNARDVAFSYYTMALRELRLVLNKSLAREECGVVIATVLQLSSFDVLHSLPIAN